MMFSLFVFHDEKPGLKSDISQSLKVAGMERRGVSPAVLNAFVRA
jgi:hypothetical protein